MQGLRQTWLSLIFFRVNLVGCCWAWWYIRRHPPQPDPGRALQRRQVAATEALIEELRKLRETLEAYKEA
jgi:hypothetical protein